MKNMSIMDFKKLSEYAEMLVKKTDWNEMNCLLNEWNYIFFYLRETFVEQVNIAALIKWCAVNVKKIFEMKSSWLSVARNCHRKCLFK